MSCGGVFASHHFAFTWHTVFLNHPVNHVLKAHACSLWTNLSSEQYSGNFLDIFGKS
jgi:hypothetical protein